MNVINVISCLGRRSTLKQFGVLIPKNNKLICRNMSNKPTVQKEMSKDEEIADEEAVRQILRGPVHYPSDLDKKILVWTGYFKKTEDVPKSVSAPMIDKAKNKARIKFANIIIFLSLLGCFGFALLGRQAAERGETVHKMNVDWHVKMNKNLETSTDR